MGYSWIKTVLAIEMFITLIIFFVVPYTEIDWNAYMQEVKGFLDGELDYRKLKGDTGPLVYPGGFIWSYSALYYITNGGKDIIMAQWIYAGIYLMLFAAVAEIYGRSKIRGRLLIRLILSKRIRSLFTLRLFNDCWAMLLLYLAILTLANGRRWKIGCLLFSMAVSIKMNILLFAPGLLMVLCRALPFSGVIKCLMVCASWQLFIAMPFLLHDPKSYVLQAFDLTRVFTYRWTVNFKCIPEEIFVSPEFGQVLLILTFISWFILWRGRWSRRLYRRTYVATLRCNSGEEKAKEICASDSEEEAFRNIALTMMESNIIGVIFSRSLHYQFLLWFFHSMPMILSATRLPFIIQIISVVAVQYGFETYPSTSTSSSVLLLGFALAWVGVIFMGREGTGVSISSSYNITSRQYKKEKGKQEESMKGLKNDSETQEKKVL